MLKSKDFEGLNYQEKKQILIDIFYQLDDKNNILEDTIFLLNASNQIQEETLNQIYNDLLNLLQNAKNISEQKYIERLKNIESKIQQESEKEWTEADTLIDNI